MAKAFQMHKARTDQSHCPRQGQHRDGVKLCQAQQVDVSGLRGRLGFTQEQFAARFAFSVATLRHGERGDRSPNGATLVLLNVIDRDPHAVMQALS